MSPDASDNDNHTLSFTNNNDANRTAEKLSAIELFSGIGGYSFAIKSSNLPINIIKAYDVNTNANQVYCFNHGLKPITTGIDRLKAKDVVADVWLMSPPCQPFTAGKIQL
jgi:tRNA (cytosine38-C5)-methyltransferase